MAALQQAKSSNERIASTFPNGLVAVFVGGTSGVGEYTLKAFTRYASKPRVYLVGRSQEAADRIVAECQKQNPGGYFEFIKADVGALKNVDDVCRQLKAKESAINILFLSQGSMGFDASEYTPFTTLRTRFLQAKKLRMEFHSPSVLPCIPVPDSLSISFRSSKQPSRSAEWSACYVPAAKAKLTEPTSQLPVFH